MSDTTAEKPKRKPRATAKKKPEPVYGKKTLVAAIVAALFAMADLYMTMRHGVKLPL